MQIIDCEQGSRRWIAARMGRPTASQMEAIVTPKGAPVKGEKRHTYLMQLLGERITRRATEHFVSAAMQRGVDLEPEARAWYEMHTGTAVKQVGFVYSDDGRAGCSPDGLCGDDGGLEIKVPTLTNHLKHLVAGGVPAHWMVQIQACLWITGRDWWDFVMYSDARDVPSVRVRVEPNAAVIGSLAEHVPAFCDELDALEAKVREQYGIPEREPVPLDDISGDDMPF